jgi:serine/threonine protein kinase
MVQCPKCSEQNPPDNRFCGFCAQPLSAPSQMPTAAFSAVEAPKAQAQTPHVARIISSDSIPAGGFTPGTILADRYRIIGLLGRGGMGEVYRADDLKLGQPVALKFLPPKLAEDPVRRERFFAEVRITRQLSHPNICRVYDIGEIDGRHFLSMEFIDGEDLASLLKRIGYLSNEKALDIARQLAAGLAAAHERGVLHRDLKPANIMLDGHGRVRITDFGLAIAAEDETQAAEIAGTPAYMAPEQLAGKGATVRSDMYSLGLVMYEIYTGKKAFTATTLAELRQQKETHTPRAISELREGMDPVVERLIRRCMEKDPNARPASVAQLALALPGGDPLAAALAAGETPSPEMVAASGSREGFRPFIAWGLLAFIILGTFAAVWMNDRVFLHRRIPFNKAPDALAERSREIIKNAGYSEKFTDSAYGFETNSDLLRYIEVSDKTSNRWKNLDAKAVLFWYRQSPIPFKSPLGVISLDNPVVHFPGEVLVKLDAEGRLVSFRIVPPHPRSDGNATAPDWTVLFTEAGLNLAQWTPTDAQEDPPDYADSIAAWKNATPNKPGAPNRVEAAALRGKPVSFEMKGPWTSAGQTGSSQSEVGPLLFLLIAIVGGLFFARRNLRLGRGDRRNATRLALFTMSFHFVCRAFGWHYSSTIAGPIVLNIGISLFYAGFCWAFYTAMEPFVRRQWPKVLVSWTRLISGDWRDPLVARNVLVGCASGILILDIGHLGTYLIPSWLGYPELDLPQNLQYRTVLGTRFLISALMDMFGGPFLATFTAIFLFFLLRVLVRNEKVVIAVPLILAAGISLAKGPASLPLAIVQTALIIFVLMRFGLVAFLASLFISNLFGSVPATCDTSAWYFPYGFATLAIFAAIVLSAFRYSLGGRPLLAASHLDD